MINLPLFQRKMVIEGEQMPPNSRLLWENDYASVGGGLTAFKAAIQVKHTMEALVN